MAMAWECGDCGWTIATDRLPSGMTLDEARDMHSERYCARPPTWPPS